jgi:hypothetical protein
VYALGLCPMDFHTGAEEFVNGPWWVVNGTFPAQRQTPARMATGCDAAEIALLTTTRCDYSRQVVRCRRLSTTRFSEVRATNWCGLAECPWDLMDSGCPYSPPVTRSGVTL